MPDPQTQELTVRVIPFMGSPDGPLYPMARMYRVIVGANPAQVNEAEREYDSTGEVEHTVAGCEIHRDRHVAIINAIINYEIKTRMPVGETVVID